MQFEMSPNMYKLILSGAIFFSIYIITLGIVAVINKKITDLRSRYSARKATLYIATILNIVLITIIWIKNLRTLSVVISVIGAGLVVALGDVFLSIAGWFLILFRRPFDTGDRVEIGDLKGDVIDIRLFQTALLEVGNWVKEDQSTGRVVHVSNSMIFKKPIFNYTRGFEFLWDEIKFVITFESDYKKAEEIMLEHGKKVGEKVTELFGKRIKKMAERYLIYYEKFTPIVYTKIVENGVELSLRYLTEVKKRRECQDMINRKILDDFEKEDKVTFAYPTYRLIK